MHNEESEESVKLEDSDMNLMNIDVYKDIRK